MKPSSYAMARLVAAILVLWLGAWNVAWAQVVCLSGIEAFPGTTSGSGAKERARNNFPLCGVP